jgi:hypothetical protein
MSETLYPSKSAEKQFFGDNAGLKRQKALDTRFA